MKMIAYLLIGIILFGCKPTKKNDALSNIETQTVALPSMMCDQCSEKIQKVVYALEGVKKVDVDVDKKTAMVTFVSVQTNLQTIERVITETGYDANGKKRIAEAYENLPQCCKIDG